MGFYVFVSSILLLMVILWILIVNGSGGGELLDYDVPNWNFCCGGYYAFSGFVHISTFDIKVIQWYLL